MKQKYFTLVIVPETTGKMTQVKCPYILIRGLLVLGIILLLAVPTVSYYMVKRYRSVKQYISTLPVLRRETNVQQLLIERYTKDLRNMQQIIAQLDREHARLLSMAGIGRPLTAPLGVGGGDDLQEASKLIKRFEQNSEEAFWGKMAEIDALQEKLFAQQELAQRLEEFLDDQSQVLRATPSIWPVPEGNDILSVYGMRTHPITGEYRMHWGIDIGARKGAPIIATADGFVSFSGERGTFGNVLVIDHGYSYTTFYGHCSTLEKEVGEHVKRGDVIARVGSTGGSTNNHLHYEIRVDGVAKDPLQFIVGLR